EARRVCCRAGFIALEGSPPRALPTSPRCCEWRSRMSWFIPSVRLLSGLALLGAFAGPAPAAPPRRPVPAPTRPAISPQFYAAMQKQFGITPDMLQGARLYTYKEILAQPLADKSPDAAEVHTYLKNPIAWQQGASKKKVWELGLPEFRLVLANGTYIR